MRLRRLGALVGATLPAIAATAMTPEKLAREVASGWIVTRLENTPDERILHPHEMVFRQRLLPIGYSRLAADAIEAKSDKPLLANGTELFRLRAMAGYVACALENRRKTGIEIVGFGRIRVCLVDKDKDGSFEAVAEYSGGVPGLPSLNGRLPKELRALKLPVVYATLDPHEAPDDLFVGIRYEGKSPITNVPRFTVAFGRGDDVGVIDQGWSKDDGGKGHLANSGIVLLDGAELQVAGLDGGDSKVAVTKPLPVGVFAVSQYGGMNAFW